MAQSTETMPIHFLLRVPRLTRIYVARSIDTIDAHAKTLQKLGHATIAKFGKPATASTVARLTKQIHEGKRTHLILVVKSAERRKNIYLGYQTEISSIRLGRPTEEIKNSAPPYYRELNYAAGLWFIVCSPLAPTDLHKFRLATNKRPVLDVLSQCRTSSMLVETSSKSFQR